LSTIETSVLNLPASPQDGDLAISPLADVQGTPSPLDLFVPGRRAAEPAPSVMQVVRAGYDSGTTVGAASRMYLRAGTASDPEFRLTPEDVKSLGEGLPQEYWPEFEKAESYEDALAIRSGLAQLAESRQTLARAGAWGTAAEVAASVLDPGMLAAAAATGGLGATARAGRIASFVAGGLATIPATIAVDGFINSQDPERSNDDVFHAALFGLAIGGGVAARQAGRAMTALRFDELRRVPGAVLTTEGRMLEDRLAKQSTKFVREIEEHAATDLNLTLAPDEIGNPTGPLRSGLFNRVLGLVVRGKKDIAEPIINRFAYLVGEDIFPRGSRTSPVPTIQSISEYSHYERSRLVGAFDRELDAAFELTKPSKVPWKRARQYEAFEKAAADAARNADPSTIADPALKAAAGVWQKHAKKAAEIAKRSGADGWDDFEPGVNGYFTRSGDHAKISDAINLYGYQNVVGVVKKAILARPKLDKGALFADAFAMTDAQADDAARVWLRMQSGFGDTSGLGRRLAMETSREGRVRAAAKDLGLAPEKVEGLVAILKPKEGSTGSSSARLGMDELAEFPVTLRDDVAGRIGAAPGSPSTLRVADLLNNNMRQAFRSYASDAIGAASTKKLLTAMQEEGGEAIASAADLLKRIDSDLQLHEIPESQRTRLVGYAEQLIRMVQGLPMDQGFSRTQNMGRVVGYLNTAVRNGSFVIPNMTEAVVGLQDAGIRALSASIPEIGAMLRSLTQRPSGGGAGTASTKLLDEIAEVVGIGNDGYVNRVVSRLDFSSETGALDAATGRASQALRQISRAGARASGLAFVTEWTQKMTAAATVQKWGQMAASGKLPSKLRLAAMGLSPERAQNILDEINRVVSRGARGRITSMNVDQMDPEVLADWLVAIRKNVGRTVQRVDVGQIPLVLHSPVARLVTQFRTFTIGALEKQLGFNLYMKDGRAAAYFLTSAFSGLLSYMGSVYYNALGKEGAERQEYLDKMTSGRSLALGVLGRAPFTSVLGIPLDYAALGAGIDPFFSPTRSSGVEMDQLFGNPTFGLIKNAPVAAFGSIRAAVDGDYDFAQKHFKAGRSFTPWQNVPVIKQFLDRVQAGLPKTAERSGSGY